MCQSDVDAQNLQDVLNSTMEYGVISPSATANAFQTNPNEPYATMWAEMASNSDELFVGSFDKGLAKVAERQQLCLHYGGPVCRVQSQQDCGLKMVGTFLPQAGYGFAVSKDDDTGLKKVLDDALLKMKQNGKLKELHRKHWDADTCGATHAQWMSAAILCSLLATFMRLL